MTTVIAFVKRHPLLTFIALTFGISWGSLLLLVGGPGAFPATAGEIERLMPIVYPLWVAGPALAGILLTGLVYGWDGLRAFSSRLRKWRVGARWYAVALLTAPLLLTAVLFALSLISPDFLPRIIATDDRVFLLRFSIIVGLVVGVIEELGWTGFAVPTLRMRHGILVTGLIVGLLTGAWQFLVVFWVDDGAAGALPPALYFPATLVTWLVAYRVLMVWVYDRTESVFVAMLMHASLITFWTMFTPLTISGAALVTYYLIFTAAVWAVIAAVAVANGGQLSRQPPRMRMA